MELYKNALKKIPVPPELIARTASSMRQASKSKAIGWRYIAVGLSAAACAAIVVFFIILNTGGYNTAGDIFITSLESGRHMGSVELVDGNLVFHNDAQSMAPPILMGGPGVRRVEWTAEQYIEYLGKEPGFIKQLPAGFTLRDEAAAVYIANDIILQDSWTSSYHSTEGGTLEISVSKGVLPPGRGMSAAENSIIKGSALAVGAGADGDIYWAQFIHDGIGYFIESKKLDQETFIRIVYDFF